MALKAILDLRRFGALLFALALLLGGAIDLAACEPERDFPVAQIALSSDSGDTHDDGASGEQHGVCAHGHCHHAGSFIPNVAVSGLLAAPRPAISPAAIAALSSAPTGPPTQPPRA